MADIVANTRVRVTATFRNLDGDLADPTTVEWAATHDGVLVDLEDADLDAVEDNPSTGVYTLTLTLTAGKWAFEAQGTGDLVVAGDVTQRVRLSAVDK